MTWCELIKLRIKKTLLFFERFFIDFSDFGTLCNFL